MGTHPFSHMHPLPSTLPVSLWFLLAGIPGRPGTAGATEVWAGCSEEEQGTVKNTLKLNTCSQFTTGENFDNRRRCKGAGRPGVQREQSPVVCRELEKMCAKAENRKCPPAALFCASASSEIADCFEPWLLFDALASLLGHANLQRAR